MKRKCGDMCPLCGGRKAPGTTTFTSDIGSGVVVIRDVPATVCSQCGQNLNEGSCNCEPEADPRWSALVDLLRNS